ncbi:MAG: DUF2079 domain-containing protein, partial [Candidatus Bathyarchaeota archaeon]|nr:DUF2079 domain-containing protein [Candidatus Bathyarchaeota archaeon]
FAWDLGIFNQALYTTLYHGKLLFSTAELFMNPSGSYLATHFSPILFILLPFYALYPSADFLIIIKSFILALGALPLYFLARETLGDRRSAFILAIAYLLHPGVQGSNWFDFQQQIFIPILTFSSAFFMVKKSWKMYFISTILSLMISEHASLVVLALSIYYLLTSNVRKIPQLFRSFRIMRETALVITILMCLISLYISDYIKGLFPIQPEFIEMYKAVGAYRVLGFKGESILHLPVYLVLNPDKIFGAFTYDYTVKLLYIVLLFAPLAFLPFGSKMTIVTFALLTPFLLSNYSAYYKIGSHYPLYVITPIFLAAIDVLSGKTRKDVYSTLKIIMVSSLIFIVSTSPISPLSYPLAEANMIWYPKSEIKVNIEVEALHKMLGLIPKNASVLTQNHIFPHVSSRINAYVLPLSSGTEEQREFLKIYVRELINKSDYIILDIRPRDYWTQFAFNEILNDNIFGPYAFTRWAILFKRGYNGSTEMMYPHDEIVFPAQSLKLNFGSLMKDDDSKYGRIAFCSKGSKRGIFIYGPYVFLPKGVYNVTWRVKFNQYGEEHLATFEVTERFGEVDVAKKYIYGFDAKPGVWGNITITFGVNKTRTYAEFRVYSTGAADISVDYVSLKQISGEAEEPFVTVETFNYRDLKFNGKVTDKGFLLRSALDEERAWSFWFGPYVSLSPGKYRVIFNLKAVPDPEADDRIIKLEVAKNYGEDIIVSMDVYGRDIIGNLSAFGWSKIELEFNLDALAENVEFRGVDPSEKYDLLLAYILLEKIDQASLSPLPGNAD